MDHEEDALVVEVLLGDLGGEEHLKLPHVRLDLPKPDSQNRFLPMPQTIWAHQFGEPRLFFTLKLTNLYRKSSKVGLVLFSR